MNTPNTPQTEVQSALRSRLVQIIQRPAEAKKEAKPSNAGLWLAYAGFNGAFGLLDLITAFTVGAMTNVLYGILAFVAGFGFMFAGEFMATRAYASKRQKLLAIATIVLAIGSTLTIGILAAIANALTYFSGLTFTAEARTWIDLAMLIGLVVIVALHGVIMGFYYFGDNAIRREQKRQEQLAWHHEQRQGLDDAKAIVNQAKAIEQEINAIDATGDLDALQAAFSSINDGRALINNEPEKAASPAGVLTDQGFRTFDAETDKPPFQAK